MRCYCTVRKQARRQNREPRFMSGGSQEEFEDPPQQIYVSNNTLFVTENLR